MEFIVRSRAVHCGKDYGEIVTVGLFRSRESAKSAAAAIAAAMVRGGRAGDVTIEDVPSKSEEKEIRDRFRSLYTRPTAGTVDPSKDDVA